MVTGTTLGVKSRFTESGNQNDRSTQRARPALPCTAAALLESLP
jgi:hypothetical protein